MKIIDAIQITIILLVFTLIFILINYSLMTDCVLKFDSDPPKDKTFSPMLYIKNDVLQNEINKLNKQLLNIDKSRNNDSIKQYYSFKQIDFELASLKDENIKLKRDFLSDIQMFMDWFKFTMGAVITLILAMFGFLIPLAVKSKRNEKLPNEPYK